MVANWHALFLGCTIGAVVALAGVLGGLIPPDHTPTILAQGFVTAVVMFVMEEDDEEES